MTYKANLITNKLHILRTNRTDLRADITPIQTTELIAELVNYLPPNKLDSNLPTSL